MLTTSLEQLPSIRKEPTERKNDFKFLVSQFGSIKFIDIDIKKLVNIFSRPFNNECKLSIYCPNPLIKCNSTISDPQ